MTLQCQMCPKRAYARLLCRAHYAQHLRRGDLARFPTVLRISKPWERRRCLAEHCTQSAYQQGFCLKHYTRVYRYGDSQVSYAGIGHPKPMAINSVTAYIFGVLKGDGCVSTDGKNYRLILHVKDRQFADNFVQALATVGCRARIYYKTDGYWLVNAHSRVLFDMAVGQMWRSLAEEHPIDFLRGFYESEGCTSVQSGSRCLHLTVSNTNRWLLEFTAGLLRVLGWHSKLYLSSPERKVLIQGQWRQRKAAYALYVRGTTPEKLALIELLDPCIKRPPQWLYKAWKSASYLGGREDGRRAGESGTGDGDCLRR